MYVPNVARYMEFSGKWSKLNILLLYLMKTKRSICGNLQQFQVAILLVNVI